MWVTKLLNKFDRHVKYTPSATVEDILAVMDVEYRDDFKDFSAKSLLAINTKIEK